MMNAVDIRDRFAALRAKGMRHKDAAAAMALSEGAAVAAHAGTHDKALRATRLRGPWVELLQALELCGPLLALTRNETTVHEKTGVYEKVSGSEAMGLALGEAIDLRLFFSRWHAGFAVSEAAANAGVPPSLSLQFFDAQGVAVHKIFVRDATDRDAFLSVVDSFTAPDEPVVFVAPEDKAAPPPNRVGKKVCTFSFTASKVSLKRALVSWSIWAMASSSRAMADCTSSLWWR